MATLSRDKPRAGQALHENIFVGLNFPEVPQGLTSVPISAPSSIATSPPSASYTDVTNSTDHIPIDNSIASPIPPVVATPFVPSSSSVQYVAPSTLSSTPPNLSNLYVPTNIEETPTTSMYPALPSFRSTMNLISSYSVPSSSRDVRYQPIPTSNDVETEVEMQDISNRRGPGHTSVQPIHGMDRGVSDQREGISSQGREGMESNLINELLSENARLMQEVESLRAVVNMQQQQQQQQQQNSTLIQSTNHTTNSLQSPHPMQGQSIASHLSTSSTSQQQQQHPAMRYIDSNTSTSISSSQGATPITALRGNIKYVCCGGCRQWLIAPQCANLIVCTSCQSINNCSLATSNSSTDNVNRTLTIQQRNWLSPFNDCLEGLVGRPFQ